jgi:hypothetical protein
MPECGQHQHEDNLKGLARMNTQWIEDAMAHTSHQRVILDMDSSESQVHGIRRVPPTTDASKVSAIISSLFNQFGDCEGATLRPGNVHSTRVDRNSLSRW